HAAATSNTTVQQMGHGIQFAGSAAMSAGVSFEETVGLMTVLANQGQRGEKAGTGLRGAILALVDPSAKAQRALMRLGISQRDLLDDEGKIRSLTGTLQKMHAAGATTTDIFSIFGQRPGGIVASLFTELKKGPNALGEAVSSIENDSLGAAQRLAEINMKGLTGAVRSLISRWDEFKLAVGDAGVTASLTAIVNWLGSLATKAAELPAPVLMVGSGLLGLAATVGPLLVGIGMTAKGFAIAKTGALLTKGAIVGLARSIAVGALLRVNALALGAGKLATVLTGRVFPALVRVGAAMLANPIGIAVAGVGGLIAAGVALYRNWDRVAGFFGGIWARIKSAFGDGLAWITSKLQGTTLGRVLSFLGLDVGSGEPAIATAPAIDTTRVASAVAPRAGQDGRARVEIDVRGGREAVAVRATEIDDVELDLSQGIALGGIG
ncbi:MAG: phage tail tape measure protein, partial [Bacteroidota bacterium]